MRHHLSLLHNRERSQSAPPGKQAPETPRATRMQRQSSRAQRVPAVCQTASLRIAPFAAVAAAAVKFLPKYARAPTSQRGVLGDGAVG
eukprot:15456075-Alexandrium_andersonii.AAC.1